MFESMYPLMRELVLPLVLILVEYFTGVSISPEILGTTEANLSADEVVVSRVVDGDTIKVVGEDNKEMTVRLVGVDTPEMANFGEEEECFAQAAKMFLVEQIETKIVKLEADTKQPNEDRYGRLLRHVYFQDKLMNEELVSQGFAKVYINAESKNSEQLLILQEQARIENKGLWRECQE